MKTSDIRDGHIYRNNGDLYKGERFTTRYVARAEGGLVRYYVHGKDGALIERECSLVAFANWARADVSHFSEHRQQYSHVPEHAARGFEFLGPLIEGDWYATRYGDHCQILEVRVMDGRTEVVAEYRMANDKPIIEGGLWTPPIYAQQLAMPEHQFRFNAIRHAACRDALNEPEEQ